MSDPSNADARQDVVVRQRIIRADGTVEDLGIVSASYRHPVRRLMWRLFGQPAAERRIRRANRNARRS